MSTLTNTLTSTGDGDNLYSALTSLPYTLNSNLGTILTTGSGTIGTGSITISPNYQSNYQWYNNSYDTVWKSALQDLSYSANFEIDKNDLLKNNIKGIRKNKFIFKCDYVGNRIQPYEFIMKLIEEKKKFSVTVKVSDILSICYSGLRFIKIENNLNFDSKCDFSSLKVKFEYDKIQYENHKLSEKELRSEKIKKINNNNEGDNN